MKILFLDVDGVINSMRTVKCFGGFPFPNIIEGSHSRENMDYIAIGMIKKLCEQTGAKIILHSSWRHHVNAIEFGQRWQLPIIGATPTVDENKQYISKPRSIKLWLKEHPEVTNYAIVDDDGMEDREHQVETTPYDGLKMRHYEMLEAILEGGVDRSIILDQRQKEQEEQNALSSLQQESIGPRSKS